ncbi:unnamed protein product [Effrenium voratum]|uniref:EF-hand domain-containing protein n=1 Tax=Effrenium voratum TaxID=2562239 RepID=A0AA36N5E3_9DINO|nr:unnamed protein product [Effrenium voratum]CAJ1449560.1 unnamed protein product [Effrenium voratum]
MKSIGKILLGGKPANASTGGPEKSLLRATSAPSLKKACVIPKWLAHELLQERNAAQAHEDWRRDVTERLQQIRRKPSLNDALNALVYQLKRDNLTEVALRKLGVSLSTSELDGILRIFDSDGSGSTDFSEFYHLIKSQEDHLPDNYVLHSAPIFAQFWIRCQGHGRESGPREAAWLHGGRAGEAPTLHVQQGAAAGRSRRHKELAWDHRGQWRSQRYFPAAA